jgi:uncharacterized UBP type Zn finger protein
MISETSIFRAKLGVGLLSGKYSQPPKSDEESRQGIPPRMFKVLIGRGHADFFSNRQQDAQEFFLYLINILNVMINFTVRFFYWIYWREIFSVKHTILKCKNLIE